MNGLDKPCVKNPRLKDMAGIMKKLNEDKTRIEIVFFSIFEEQTCSRC